jgi:hypothetical protein
MGSCAAPSAKGDDKFITTDYLQQCQFITTDYLQQCRLSRSAAEGSNGGACGFFFFLKT